MASFDDNKAAKGQRPYDSPVDEKPAGIGETQSNQERGTGTTSRTVKPDVNGTDNAGTYMENVRVISNQARYKENTEVPSDELKNPLSRYLSKTLPAVQNPDAENNRAYSRPAPGRVVGTKRTL